MSFDITMPQLVNMFSNDSPFTLLLALGASSMQAAFPVVPLFIVSGAISIVYGFKSGLLISWTGSVIGSTLTFMAARRLGREWTANKIGARYNEWQQHLTWKTIAAARLIPIAPAPVINLCSGISKVTTPCFILATAIGNLPYLALYSFTGDSLTKIKGLTIMLLMFYFILLIVLGFITKFAFYRK